MRVSRRSRFLAGAAAAALLGAGAIALGARGTTATHLDCGDTVVASVTLDEDLLGCTGVGLFVGADKITINLNGERRLRRG